MRVATVKIRNKKTGNVLKINQEDWAGDLGTNRFVGWERVGAERMGDEDTSLEVKTEEAIVVKVEAAVVEDPTEDKTSTNADVPTTPTNEEVEEEKPKRATRRRRN